MAGAAEGVQRGLRGVLSTQKRNQEQWWAPPEEAQEYQGLVQASLLAATASAQGRPGNK